MSQNYSLNKKPLLKKNVYKYHYIGYCKYRDKRFFLHSSEDCDENVKDLFTLRETKKSECTEKIEDININVNSEMTKKEMEITSMKYLTLRKLLKMKNLERPGTCILG